MKASIASLIPLVSLISLAGAVESWVNPLVTRRADPHVILHVDGNYYLTATVPEYDRIVLRRAASLGGLALAGEKVVWTKAVSGPMSHHIWAPEIHFLDGKWYLYFSAGRAESIWDIRLYVLENASPDPLSGTWVEKGQIRMNHESFTLDGHVFHHKGRRYLTWAQSAEGERGTGIYLARMDTPWSITGRQVRISRPEFSWEKAGHEVNEAPAVIVRHGRVFLTYSASATDANYCLGLLTADEDADLLDPASWVKSREPVFRSSPRNRQYGPGHNAFVTSVDGRTDYLVYHARSYERIEGEPLHNPDRAIRAQVLRWDADGRPDFGEPVAEGLCKVQP